MSHSHRVAMYWLPRRDDLDAQAHQLQAAVDGLSMFAEWAPERPGDTDGSFSEPGRYRALLEAGQIDWRTGEIEHRSYRACLVSQEGSRLEVTSGIQPFGMDAMFTPNRAELRVNARRDTLEPTAFVAMAAALVHAFTPLFGFVGDMRWPVAPTAVFSDGRPRVGWMTFLEARFGEVPPPWNDGVVTYPVDDGFLILAQGEVFDSRESASVAALKDAEQHLQDLLKPHRLMV
ncbi:MAG: hypothetical protein AAGA56_20065 [Myxococcota bacterium]